MKKHELIELLESTKTETARYFDLPEDSLKKTYGKDKWSVRQILHHLTDTEMIFITRLKRVIAEPTQVIWAFDPDDWNKAFDYANQPLKNKKELYLLCREVNHQLIENFYEEFHQKQFVHSEMGLRTLQDEFEKVALHNQNHLKQIKIALEK